MNTREKEVLNMQLTLIPLLAEKWSMNFCQLSQLFHQYDVLSYIDTCYENYNSTGNPGIIEDLKEYIELQGGHVA